MFFVVFSFFPPLALLSAFIVKLGDTSLSLKRVREGGVAGISEIPSSLLIVCIVKLVLSGFKECAFKFRFCTGRGRTPALKCLHFFMVFPLHL
jgi:hypothetical protein